MKNVLLENDKENNIQALYNATLRTMNSLASLSNVIAKPDHHKLLIFIYFLGATGILQVRNIFKMDIKRNLNNQVIVQ